MYRRRSHLGNLDVVFLERAEDDGVHGGGGSGGEGSSVEGEQRKGSGVAAAAAGEASPQSPNASSPHLSDSRNSGPGLGERERGVYVLVGSTRRRSGIMDPTFSPFTSYPNGSKHEPAVRHNRSHNPKRFNPNPSHQSS